MLISPEIFDLIDDIVERSYQDFTYQLLGKDFLTKEQQLQVEALGMLVGQRPLLELVYLLVRQRSEERYQTDQTLQSLLAGIFATGILGGLSDVSRATLEMSLQAMDTVIERAKAETKVAIKFQITEYNRIEQNSKRRNSNFFTPGPQDDFPIPVIMLAIGAALVTVQKNFQRDFTTELTNLTNQAATDYAMDVYGSGAVLSGNVYAMKKVVLDDRTSNHCKTHYLNQDGSPRIYTLAELIANGVNDYRDKSSWKATAGCDHPRCRSQLIILGTNPRT